MHNLVVCTLCSCYPWPVLGLPPVWYKSAPYRSRAVIDPRGVLREFGLELAGGRRSARLGQHGRAALPGPAGASGGTEKLTEEELAALVTRDSMVGVAKVSPAGGPGMNGVHDMGGMHGMGPIRLRTRRARVPRAVGRPRVIALNCADSRVAQMEHRRRPPRDRADPAGRLSAHELLRKVDRRGSRSCWSNPAWSRAEEIASGQPAPGSPKATPAAHG